MPVVEGKYRVHFDCVQPGQMGYASFRVVAAEGATGQSVCVEVSAILDPPDPRFVVRSACANLECDLAEGDCCEPGEGTTSSSSGSGGSGFIYPGIIEAS